MPCPPHSYVRPITSSRPVLGRATNFRGKTVAVDFLTHPGPEIDDLTEKVICGKEVRGRKITTGLIAQSRREFRRTRDAVEG